ncbi:MAG: zinc ribbon domain-containing protein [Gallionella sp.]|nr:zinc ribbon domain-containing protein [Gallionella sp.]
MPIYTYGCSSCGLQKDVLQKLSDAPLTVCPECGKETFTKQLTSAGFQLKGSGYYATDFKDSGKAEPKAEPACAPACASASSCPVAGGAA